MIDIIVPVLGRPQNAPRFTESLAEATLSEHDLLFICSPGDEAQIAACREFGETYICSWEPGSGDFARKINQGFRLTEGEFFLIGADDLVFQRGWDIFALQAAERRGFGVIGTQDLGNPAVKAGLTSTHPLVRRSYIEEQGGTFDEEPGVVLCERYDHQFVDTELSEVAKARGRWTFAKKAIVEHLHPVWGKAEWDPTYEKAFRATKADARLHARRKSAYLRRQRYTRAR